MELDAGTLGRRAVGAWPLERDGVVSRSRGHVCQYGDAGIHADGGEFSRYASMDDQQPRRVVVDAPTLELDGLVDTGSLGRNAMDA